MDNKKRIVGEKAHKTKDVYWWLGPAGVISVIILILFAMIKSSTPVRLDDLPARAKNRVKRAILGKQRAIWLGMEVSPMTKDAAVEFAISIKQKGVVITDLDQGQGANSGMNVGDVIIAINGAKITDFESFLWLAKQSKFSDGIFLDVITNGMRRYVSMPFTFQGGPLMGPNANHWQLGAPINPPALGYGKLAAFGNTANPSFMLCPNCGHSAQAMGPGPYICPNCRIQMIANQ